MRDNHDMSPDSAATTLPTPEENYRRALLVFTLVVAVIVGMTNFPTDDGLRHVGVAFGEPRSWSEVYPHSVFAENPGYNPWWGYDMALRGVATVMRPLGLPRIVAQTVVVRILSIGFLAAFLVLAIDRSGLAAKVRSRESLAAAAALITVLLSLPIARVITVRPFVLGSLYLLFALPGGGVIRGAIAAGLLGICYPHLFWIYTVPVGLSHLWRGDRRFGAGTLVMTAATVAALPREFWGFLGGLARSDLVKAALPVKIEELRPATAEPFLTGAVVLALVCILPYLPTPSRRIGVPHLLMIFFIPPSVKYVRYLIDIEMVLLFVLCGTSLVDPIATQLARISAFWLERLRSLAARLGRWRPGASGAVEEAVNLRPVIAMTSVVLVVVLAAGSSKRHREDAALAQILEAVPSGSLVVTEFNLQYPLLFVRPDLGLVPSCEIGFATESILPAYRRFFEEGDPCELARAVGAEWFAGSERLFLDPGNATCLTRKVGRTGAAQNPGIVLWRIGPG